MEDNRAELEKAELEKTAAALTEYFVPQFIKECEARGITFKNEAELTAGIESAITIQHVAGQKQEKQASESGIIRANEMLKQHLGIR
jgi:hypothetical protein